MELTNAERAEVLKETLHPIIEALMQGLGENLIALVLFGSRARGDAKEHSDWDVLLIARKLPEHPLERLRFLQAMFLSRWQGRIAFVAKTLEEFEGYLAHLYLDIALDGIVLYDPTGYATERFEKLRWHLERIRLDRIQRGRDLIWWWKDKPPKRWRIEWDDVYG